jgi:hypothetical protein
MIYLICSILFWVGALGVAILAMMGGLHTGHAGHAGQGGGVTHPGHAHAGHDSQGARSQHDGQQSRGASLLLTILSPLTIFSVCLGAGATGLLVRSFHLPTLIVAIVALAGGVAFFAAIIRPLLTVVLMFASKPSKALEGTIAQQAEAITTFDASGKGLVQLTVDGQLVRILATLETDEHVQPSDVSPGDRLTVTSVDGHKNTCRVARF